MSYCSRSSRSIASSDVTAFRYPVYKNYVLYRFEILRKSGNRCVRCIILRPQHPDCFHNRIQHYNFSFIIKKNANGRIYNLVLPQLSLPLLGLLRYSEQFIRNTDTFSSVFICKNHCNLPPLNRIRFVCIIKSVRVEAFFSCRSAFKIL